MVSYIEEKHEEEELHTGSFSGHRGRLASIKVNNTLISWVDAMLINRIINSSISDEVGTK